MGIQDVFMQMVTGSWVNGAMDTQYRVERHKEKTVITFMGSVSWVDWISNFMFWKVPYKDMAEKWYAHAGFLEAWKAVRDEIVALVDKSLPVEVYGYSRGGGIAILAFEWFRYNGYSVQGMVFGAPRAVAFRKDSRIAERFLGLISYKNRGDIVTMLPPSLFGYKSVGASIRLGKGIRLPRTYWHLVPQYIEELKDA